MAVRPRHPRAAQKNLAEHVAIQADFLDTKLKPCLDAAQAGEGHVFFVDAAHFVFGTFLCCLWSFARIYVRAASGRQRFNVLGAWNAVTRELIAVTNTTVVNTETISELLRKIAGSGLTLGSFGQNQPIKAAATGTAPITSAHGVKIEQTNVTVVASAETSGQMLGSGDGSRRSGIASVTVVRRSSRSFTRSPCATGRVS